MFGCSRIMKARADQGVNWMDLWWWRVYSTWVNLGFVFREESEKKKLTWCNRRVSYGLNCFFSDWIFSSQKGHLQLAQPIGDILVAGAVFEQSKAILHCTYAGIFRTNRGKMDHAWVGCRSVGDIQNPTRGWTAVSSETTQHQHEWTGRNLNLQKRKENIAYRPHPSNREQANLRARYKRPVSTHTVCIYRKTKAIIIGLMV
jgi:hypothetical protein